MAQSLEIVITCHNFQHRLNWMLSSIVSQCDDKIPVIRVNIAHVKNNGSPSCEDLASFFFHKYGLDFELVTYDNTEELQYRGLARNRQITKAKSDWILFADSDMVYTKTFWPSLKLFMDRNRKTDKMSHLGRYSCDVDLCDELLKKYAYPCMVPNAATMCSQLPIRTMRNCGAGYFQLIRRATLMEKLDGIYVDPKTCRDWSWKRGQKARSDIQFRRRVECYKMHIEELLENNKYTDGILKKKRKDDPEAVLSLDELPVQFHLNHLRDNEIGKHLETQR